MIKKRKNTKNSVHEHLGFILENTTYADRLSWLEQSQEFVRKVEKLRKQGKLWLVDAHHFVNQVKESRASYGKK